MSIRFDGLPYSPAADRNKAPIGALLQRLLPARGTALEVAAGTGQHAAHLAALLPGWSWLPTEADRAALAAIVARCAGLANVRPPIVLDVCAGDWPGVPERLDLVYCANLLHIAPWQATQALMRGTARYLAPGGLLVVYGPFLEEGVPTAPSNLDFDADLRRRDPDWGLRRLADVTAEAGAAGLALRERAALPANNLALVYARLPDSGKRGRGA